MMHAIFSIPGIWFMAGMWIGGVIGLIAAGLLAAKRLRDTEEESDFLREAWEASRRDVQENAKGTN